MFDPLTTTIDRPELASSPVSVAGLENVALRDRVDDFLFSMERWVDPRALARYCEAKSGTPAQGFEGDFFKLSDVQKRRLISMYFPTKDMHLVNLTRDWRARLALLPASDWMKLGFAVSVLPFCGHVQRSMDGNFRRAVREAFAPTIWSELDVHTSASVDLQFLLGHGAWKTTSAVAAGGVRCAIEQACDWPEVVRKRVCLKLDPVVMEAPVSVRGLTPYWLEIACKITLQDHPWLWS